MKARLAIAFATSLGLCAMAGCQSSQPQNAPLPPAPRSYDFSGQTDTAAPESVIPTDPAASRLQDIGGQLLVYYSEYKRLPQSLDELKQLPDGDQLDLTSPRAGREFDYYPSGLWSEEHADKCVVATDPVEFASKRWCLLMTPPTTGLALVVTVVDMPETVFGKYHPTGP